MQRLSEVLGSALDAGTSTMGQKYAPEERYMGAKSLRTEPALYMVTMIVPISQVSLDSGKAIIQVTVLAGSEEQAVYKAGVTVRRASG